MSHDMVPPEVDYQTTTKYFVYILFLSNGTLYTGYTERLEDRLKEHLDGKVASTAPHRPLKRIHYEVYALQTDALRREKFLKTTEGKRLLRKQLRDVLRELQYDGV